MKLYYMSGACSLAPHIAAREAGLDVALASVNLRAEPRLCEGQDYYEINPKGAVPALLLDDGSILTENAVILQYLAAQAPDSKLAPAPTDPGHWRFLELLNFVATEVHKSFGPLFNPATSPEAREAAVAHLGKRFDLLDKMLDGQDYLTGEDFTVADAYVFTVVNWTNFMKLDLSPWPKLQAFMGRVAARPGVQTALREEGLIQ